MTKHYCDICGKECAKLEEIKVPTEKTFRGFNTKPAQVCRDCAKEYDNIIDKLTDIRFILFRDFMSRRSAESLKGDTEGRDKSKPEGIAKAKAIYKGFSSHDCGSYYTCSVCGRDFTDYSVERNDPRCPGCKAVLEDFFK